MAKMLASDPDIMGILIKAEHFGLLQSSAGPRHCHGFCMVLRAISPGVSDFPAWTRQINLLTEASNVIE